MNETEKKAGQGKASKLSTQEKHNLKITKQIRLAVVKAGGIEALAGELGINTTTVWRWTVGSTRPRSKPVLQALAKFLAA